MNQLQSIGQGLQVAFDTLQGIASRKGHSIQSVTVNVGETDLSAGRIVGNVTVNNRSRRPFKLEVVNGSGVNVTLLGVTERIAA